jgi:hypothetical protein
MTNKLWCSKCGGWVTPREEDAEFSNFVYYKVCPDCNVTLERCCGNRHGEAGGDGDTVDGTEGDDECDVDS